MSALPILEKTARKSCERLENSVRLYSHTAPTTIKIMGITAKASPCEADSSVIDTGILKTVMASTTARPKASSAQR